MRQSCGCSFSRFFDTLSLLPFSSGGLSQWVQTHLITIFQEGFHGFFYLRTYWSGSISRELRCPFSQALAMGLPYASSNTLKFNLYLGTNGMHIRAVGNNLIQFSQVFWHSLTKVNFKVWLNLSTFLNDWSLQAECRVHLIPRALVPFAMWDTNAGPLSLSRDLGFFLFY